MKPLVSQTGLALRVAGGADANVLDKAMKLVACGPDEESLVQFSNVVEAFA